MSSAIKYLHFLNAYMLLYSLKYIHIIFLEKIVFKLDGISLWLMLNPYYVSSMVLCALHVVCHFMCLNVKDRTEKDH